MILFSWNISKNFLLDLMQNIARKTKRARPPNLKELLLLAVERMMFPGVRPCLIVGLLWFT